VELFRDVAWLALPTSEAAVRDSIGRLKLGTVLKGFRGKPPADINALVQAILTFGDQFVASMPALLEFEINPLLVMPQGRGVIAVDALIVRCTEAVEVA
jgi:acetyl-CoA synthetase